MNHKGQAKNPAGAASGSGSSLVSGFGSCFDFGFGSGSGTDCSEQNTIWPSNVRGGATIPFVTHLGAPKAAETVPTAATGRKAATVRKPVTARKAATVRTAAAAAAENQSVYMDSESLLDLSSVARGLYRSADKFKMTMPLDAFKTRFLRYLYLYVQKHSKSTITMKDVIVDGTRAWTMLTDQQKCKYRHPDEEESQ